VKKNRSKNKRGNREGRLEKRHGESGISDKGSKKYLQNILRLEVSVFTELF